VVQLFNFFFLLDMAVCFRTAVIDDGIFLCGTREMASYYLQGWFMLDVIANITTFIELLSTSGGVGAGLFFKNVRMIKMFRIIKLVRVSRLVTSLSQLAPNLLSFQMSASSGDGVVSKRLAVLLKVFLLLCATAHMCACGMAFLIPTAAEDNEHFERFGEFMPSWAFDYFGSGHHDLGIEVKYSAAFYWAIVTVTTVGYGDITPSTDWERLYSTVVCFVGTIAFAYMTSQITAVVFDMSAARRRVRQKMEELEEFMGFYEFAKPLRMDIRTFFSDRFQSSFFDAESILAGIPIQLQQKASYHIRRHSLTQIPLLHGAPGPFLDKLMRLANDATEIEMGESECIPSDAYLFIEKGAADVHFEDGQGHFTGRVKPHENLMEHRMWHSDEKRGHEVKVEAKTELLRFSWLSQQRWFALLSAYPHFQRSFHRKRAAVHKTEEIRKRSVSYHKTALQAEEDLHLTMSVLAGIKVKGSSRDVLGAEGGTMPSRGSNTNTDAATPKLQPLGSTCNLSVSQNQSNPPAGPGGVQGSVNSGRGFKKRNAAVGHVDSSKLICQLTARVASLELSVCNQMAALSAQLSALSGTLGVEATPQPAAALTGKIDVHSHDHSQDTAGRLANTDPAEWSSSDGDGGDGGWSGGAGGMSTCEEEEGGEGDWADEDEEEGDEGLEGEDEEGGGAKSAAAEKPACTPLLSRTPPAAGDSNEQKPCKATKSAQSAPDLFSIQPVTRSVSDLSIISVSSGSGSVSAGDHPGNDRAVADKMRFVV
jgi:hypothetical protein